MLAQNFVDTRSAKSLPLSNIHPYGQDFQISLIKQKLQRITKNSSHPLFQGIFNTIWSKFLTKSRSTESDRKIEVTSDSSFQLREIKLIPK